VKYCYDSSLCGVGTNKFILSTKGVLILQILEFLDMLHFFFFNFCTYIQTWMSIFIELILKFAPISNPIWCVPFQKLHYSGNLLDLPVVAFGDF
jgi:hypothetical protein